MGIDLDPGSTHVFLCGNPAMIGIPEEHDSTAVFPEPVGVVELLTKRGFTLDRHRQIGNIHVEEYW
jgi:ferredoxin--NADP+ reductase